MNSACKGALNREYGATRMAHCCNDFKDITKDGLAEEFMAMYNDKMKHP
jgi:hypothetical protein